MTPHFTSLVAAALAIVALTPGVLAAQEKISRYPAHYLVIEASEVSDMEVMHYRRVTLAGPLGSLDDHTLKARTAVLLRHEGSVGTIRLRDTTGRVAYQGLVAIPRIVRSERRLASDDTRAEKAAPVMDGQVAILDRTSFVVRVPVLADANDLEVVWQVASDDEGAGASASAPAARYSPLRSTSHYSRWNLGEIAERPSRVPPEMIALPKATLEPVPGLPQGPPDNRVDVLFVAEGYRQSDLSTCQADTNALANGLVSATPFQEYAGHFNMWRLHVPSTQRGADRPRCPTDPPAGGVDDGTMVSTDAEWSRLHATRHRRCGRRWRVGRRPARVHGHVPPVLLGTDARLGSTVL